MPDAMFCTVEDVIKLLPMSGGNVTHDAAITTLIQTVSTDVAAYCRRSFVSRLVVKRFKTFELHSESSRQIYYMPDKPIVDDADLKVWYDIYEVFGDDTLLERDLDYEVDTTKGYVRVHKNLYSSVRGLKIQARVGYTMDNTGLVAVPVGVKMATAQQVAFLFLRQTNRELGNKTVSRSNVEVEVATASSAVMVPEAAGNLRSHRFTLVGNDS